MFISIADLPTEVLDYILDFLPFYDKKRARLVCRQWYHQLSSKRFFKATKLRLDLYRAQRLKDTLLRAADQRQIQCIGVYDWTDTASEEDIACMVQVIEAFRFSLADLSFHCSKVVQRAVCRAVVKMRPLRHLTVGFAFLTHLEIPLDDESQLELLSSLASQLNFLKLRRTRKDLLLRCFNELHLVALRTMECVGCEELIQPGELGDGCWRMLARLETFRYMAYNRNDKVLEEMLPHFRNLKCLAIDYCSLSTQYIDNMYSFLAVKLLDLRLNQNERVDSYLIGPYALLHLPNLEYLSLSVPAKITLSEQMPRLISLTINGQETWPSDILAQVKKINGIGERRLRKLLLTEARVDHYDTDSIGALSIDVLFFDQCFIDGSLLEVLAKPETRQKILRIVMRDCALTFQNNKSYSIQTIGELRTKCPYLHIAATESPYFKGERKGYISQNYTMRCATY